MYDGSTVDNSGREAEMAAPTYQPTIGEAMREVRAFARDFPTPAVRRMMSLVEQGRITWWDAYRLSQKALSSALTEVV